MPADAHATLPLPGLTPVAGKPIIARFDGGSLSSDGGLLALREVEARLGVARRLAACIDDPRAPERIQHSLAEILRFRLLMIAAGYEDGNDADSLRHDPLFKLANGRLPDEAARAHPHGARHGGALLRGLSPGAAPDHARHRRHLRRRPWRAAVAAVQRLLDRKSTRLNSSH